MRRKVEKILSVLLVLALVWGMIPTVTLNAETSGDYYGREALKALPNKTALLYAYDAIVNGVENSDATISIYNGVDSISKEEMEMVLDVYLRDHTEHFWIGNTYGLSYNSSTILKIVPNYILTGTELTAARAKFDAKVNEILSGLTSSMSEFEKELYLHDKLASMVTYVGGTHAHDSYGALVEGKAVCEGYAEALQYLLQKAGIQSFIAEGTSINPSTGNPENHAWNYVRIDGKYYHTDLTWNDTGDRPYHAYFNINDALIKEDHYITEVTYTLPTCNSLDNQYFNVKEGKITTPYSATDIGTMLKNNDKKIHVYISENIKSEDVGDFATWFTNDANITEIATTAGLTGGYSYSYSKLGREYILEVGCYEHVYTEKLADEAHLVPGTGANCQSAKEYYYDCVNCSSIGTTKWTSTEVGPHSMSAEWTKTATHHFHECTVSGCDYEEDKDTHTANIENATETEDKVCTVCAYVIEEKLGHLCRNHLTAVTANPAECDAPGNKAYYTCDCGKWYEDDKATVEITDKGSVVIPKTGHDYTEKIKDAAHLVLGTGANCQSAKEYYYDCAKCNSIGTIKWTSTEYGAHNFTEKLEDAAHLVSGTGVNCQSEKAYYFDCEYCDEKGTTTWNSGNYGDHNVSTAWTTEAEKHFHKCTLCDYKEDEAACSGGTATCQEKAKCATCGTAYGSLAAHNFETTWGYKEEDGHAHRCQTPGCTEMAGFAVHTPNIPNATETEDKVCTVCAYVIEVKTGHICKNNLTAVTANPAECEIGGNKAYYTCTCGKWYADGTALVEITDKDSVNIPKLGHDYTEEIKDAAHLRTEATNCQETTTYWYDCSRCDKSAKDDLAATDRWYVVGTGLHSFTEKLADAAHLVPGTGVNCQSQKEYYFDCAHCDEKGTTTWNSGNYGDHNVSTAWTTEAEKHFHKCTLCDYKEDEAACSGGTATCQEKAKCATCGTAYGSLAAHNFETTWGYKEEDGHAHRCQTPGCTEMAGFAVHTPNIPNATETEDKVCTVCAYVIEVKTGHICKNNLTAVTANPAECEAAGNKAYYTCTCGKWYADGTALVEITDKDSVVIPKLGHDYTEEIKDAAHLRTDAANCQETTTYWYDCSRCDKSAEDDLAATDKWYATEAGSHQVATEWTVNKDEHFHKCTVSGCDYVEDKAAHIPNIPNATETEDKVCTVCAYVIEVKTGHLCKNHLTAVTANPAECDAAGNKAYYTCDCGKWYEDDKATVEITDKDSVVIPKLGHDYTEEIKDEAHLRTEATNCQETTTYWYDCSRCAKNAKDDLAATDKWYVVGTGAHSFTEKLADAAHLVPGTGANCQSEKVYYFDCEYCDEKGTTTWNSGNYGDHNVSTAWITELGEHFHKCTVSGCDYEEDRATCSGGTATCQAKAECATCGTAYGSLAAHNFETTWGYKEADGHAHKCQTPGCTEMDGFAAHTANIPNATEEDDKVCTVCAYVIEVATGHLCKNHLTAVTANAASCDVAGNKAYYACTCGEWYADGTATIKITDKDSVVIPKLGHDYTKEVKDAAHLRSEATNCQEKTSYWYDCSRCGKNAKNDAAAVNGWFATEAGSHSFTAQKENDLYLVPGTGVDCQSLKEFYVACEFCDGHGTQTWVSTTYGEHTANIPNATQTEEKVCTVCDKVLEEKLPEAPVKPEKPENPEKPDSPQTSDMNQTTFVMFALAASMSAIVISIFNRKRKTVE